MSVEPRTVDVPVNILIVDDQPRNLDALESILESPDHRLVRAQDSQQALLEVLNTDFAAIVLDIKMPGIGGIELASLIKSRKRSRHVPILLLTAHSSDEVEVLQGYGAGAVDYLSKPINPTILRSKIGVFVDLFRKTRALAAANSALEAEIAERQVAQDALRKMNDELEARVRERTQDLMLANAALRDNQEELRRHNKVLDSTVLERTRALDESHERLRHSERLASVGTLAAGLGHDMSNLLMPLRVRLESLAAACLTPEAAEHVAAIGQAASYLQRLASGLRLLASDPDQVRESRSGIDVALWWRDTEGVLRAGLPRGVSLEGQIDAELPQIAIAASRLTQAVFNLVQNAGEAIASSHSGKPGQIYVRASAAQDGATKRVRILVEDNGPGMTPEVIARCFEPYFSTKTRAVSTGMGLPIVRAWVEAAGGHIKVRSTPQAGTTFIIDLPCSQTAAAPSVPARSRRAAVQLADARMRSLLNQMLQTAGYDVLETVGTNGLNVDLWVVEGAAAAHERLFAFALDDPARKVIALADAAPAGRSAGWERADLRLYEQTVMDRVTYLGPRPAFSALRAAVVSALHDIHVVMPDAPALAQGDSP